jgi:hypothetical protein
VRNVVQLLDPVCNVQGLDPEALVAESRPVSIGPASELVGLLVLVERVRASDGGGLVPLSLLQGGSLTAKAWGVQSAHVKQAEARIAELQEIVAGPACAPMKYDPDCPTFLKHLVIYCHYKVCLWIISWSCVVC